MLAIHRIGSSRERALARGAAARGARARRAGVVEARGGCYRWAPIHRSGDLWGVRTSSVPGRDCALYRFGADRGRERELVRSRMRPGCG